MISRDPTFAPASDPVGRPPRWARGVDGVRMRQLNTIQAVALALVLAAVIYMALYQGFLLVGDFARWAL